jgi:hypothetical protein
VRVADLDRHRLRAEGRRDAVLRRLLEVVAAEGLRDQLGRERGVEREEGGKRGALVVLALESGRNSVQRSLRSWPSTVVLRTSAEAL